MLFKITILTSLIFAVIYPTCFLISAKDPLKDNFHKFHVGLPNTVGGVVLIFVLISSMPVEIKGWVVIWKILLLVSSRFYWKKQYPNPYVISFPTIIGLIAFGRMHAFLVNGSLEAILISILGGFIFCSAFFTMNLGHWYLNVHGLPIKHLKNATYAFWGFLGLRDNLGWLLLFYSSSLFQWRDDILI